MNCKNCGGEYRLRDLQCPYCGTENVIGRVWMKQRTEAELEYERKRKEAGRKASRYAYNRGVTRVLVIEILFFVLLIFGMVVYSFVESMSPGRSKTSEELAALYEEGRYAELYQEIRDDLYRNDDPVISEYVDVCLYARIHDEFVNDKLHFLGLSEQEKKEDDFYLGNSIRYALRMYRLDGGYYRIVEEKHPEMVEQYRREADAYLLGTLGMTREELDDALAVEYLYSVDMDKVEKKVRERNGW